MRSRVTAEAGGNLRPQAKSAHPANNFDAIRLLGALMVLVSHQFALSGRPEPHVAGDVSLGALGVLIFFSISGYLVASSWRSDPSLPRFIARRLLRIWPGLAASVVLTSAVYWFVSGRLASPRFLANLLFVSADGSFFASNPQVKMNGSLWTVQLEVLCYIAFACLGRFMGRNLETALLLVAILAAPAYLMFEGSRLDAGAVVPGIRLFPYFAAFFFAGAAQLIFRPGAVAMVAIVSAGLILLACAHIALGLWLIVPSLTIAIGRRSWPIVARFGRFGDLSYGIYLWAWPVQQAEVGLLGKDTPYVTLLSVSLLFVVPIAWMSWHLVEKRALALKPSRFRNDPVKSGFIPVGANQV
ncbi:MAG: acyltransferase [Proteobacteria bacterium]|nr:acyltransferase [Pseudomonadota bacterium]